MKHPSLIFCAALSVTLSVALFLSSCNTNDPDTKKGGDTPTSQHQPSDPATWSPVGKMYVRDRSAEHVNGNDYFYEVVWFNSGDSAIWYNSIVADYTQMNETYPCAYVIEYPDATLTFFDVNHDKYYFTDTLTLYSANSSGAFILAN